MRQILKHHSSMYIIHIYVYDDITRVNEKQTPEMGALVVLEGLANTLSLTCNEEKNFN